MGGRHLIFAVTFLLSQLLISQASAQTRYPAERDHSPITRQVAEGLKDIVTTGSSQGKIERRFIKVGDSITVSPDYFMGQYIHPDYDPQIHTEYDYTRDLDRYEYLRESMEFFLAEVISGGETSFDRQSLAAQSGQTASWAISGSPSPLQQEIDAVSPAYAVIMFGTNDIGWWTDDHYVMSWIIENLAAIVDSCISEGTVPILKAPPLRVDYELKMLTLSHLIRALAQARQIPFINYHRAMMPLPDYGLGTDGVHPNVYQWNWMCHLTPAGLQYGTNMHNLVAMQAFDRALRATVMGVPALDFEPPALIGDGAQGNPYQVDGLPFVDAGQTSADSLDVYYTLNLAQSRAMRFMVTSQGSTDVDVTLLDDAFGLIDSDDGLLDLSLTAGQYYLVIETRDGIAGNAGEYQALIMDRSSTGMPGGHGIFIDGAKVWPAEVAPDQPVDLTITVTALDDSGISSVTLDLSELGGGSSVAMTDLGAGSYSHTASLPAQSLGEKLVTVTAEDDEANHSSIPAYVKVGTTLTVTNVGIGGAVGTVTSVPAGIDCGSDCSEDFAIGTAVTLTAAAEPGSSFAGWSGACSGSDPACVVTMLMSQSVTAAFHSATVPTFVIYDDALGSGWQDWSWNATIDLSGGSPVHTGDYAVNAMLDAWGAFSPATQSTVVDTVGYGSLELWLHGGTGSDKVLTVTTQSVADDAGTEGTPVEVTAVANTWTEISITLADLGDPAAIARVNFMNLSGSALGSVSFDEIRLEPLFSDPGVFADGFESGNLSAWSAAVP